MQVSVYIDEELLNEVDAFVKEVKASGIPFNVTRSNVVSQAIRNYLASQQAERQEAK